MSEMSVLSVIMTTKILFSNVRFALICSRKMSVGGVIILVLENKERLGNKMTNTKKCKCDKAHSLLDIFTVENNKVENIQKWHSCYYCGKYQVSKWIRYHEVGCFYAHKNKESLVK